MPQIIGAFIFPNLLEQWNHDEATRRFKLLRDFGVNTIATESETYRNDVIDLAHRLGMRFVGGIACFSDHRRNHQLLHSRPELWPILENGERRPLMEWYVGVTPTVNDYREERLYEIERIIHDYEIDAMCLDFIRWPLHWELELRPGQPEPLQSSFDPHTIRQFLEFARLEMPPSRNTVHEQANWILSEHRAAWTDFKCKGIADFVRAARERIQAHRGPEVQLGMYIVPAPDEQRAYWVGQRAADLAPITDFLAPMVYHPILYRSPEWATQVIDDVVRLAPGKVLPVLQVDSAEGKDLGSDWGPPVPVNEWKTAACSTAKRRDTLGLIAFTGTALFADGRGEALAECLAV